MSKEKGRGKNLSSKDMQMKGSEDQTFEQKKRAAYAAMGRLGGLARAKQMAEKGFSMADELKKPSPQLNKKQREKS